MGRRRRSLLNNKVPPLPGVSMTPKSDKPEESELDVPPELEDLPATFEYLDDPTDDETISFDDLDAPPLPGALVDDDSEEAYADDSKPPGFTEEESFPESNGWMELEIPQGQSAPEKNPDTWVPEDEYDPAAQEQWIGTEDDLSVADAIAADAASLDAADEVPTDPEGHSMSSDWQDSETPVSAPIREDEAFVAEEQPEEPATEPDDEEEEHTPRVFEAAPRPAPQFVGGFKPVHNPSHDEFDALASSNTDFLTDDSAPSEDRPPALLEDPGQVYRAPMNVSEPPPGIMDHGAAAAPEKPAFEELPNKPKRRKGYDAEEEPKPAKKEEVFVAAESTSLYSEEDLADLEDEEEPGPPVYIKMLMVGGVVMVALILITLLALLAVLVLPKPVDPGSAPDVTSERLGTKLRPKDHRAEDIVEPVPPGPVKPAVVGDALPSDPKDPNDPEAAEEEGPFYGLGDEEPAGLNLPVVPSGTIEYLYPVREEGRRRVGRQRGGRLPEVEGAGGSNGGGPAGDNGRIKIRSNMRVLVYINGQPRGYTPIDIDRPAGTYSISAYPRGQDHLEKRKTVYLTGGQIKSVMLEF